MIGVALQAGGVKGFVHIATLKLFDICNQKPDVLAGSSFGAIVGTLYSIYEDSDKVYSVLSENIEYFLKSNNVARSKFISLELVLKESLFTLDEYYKFFKRLYERKKFSELKIPAIVVVFDFENMSSMVINEGYLVDAVLASCTVPGVFQPTYIAGSKMLDGGILSPLPTTELRNYGATKIVASVLEETKKTYNTQMELMLYIDSLKESIILQKEISNSEFVIKYPVKNSWDEFQKYKEVFDIGMNTALKRRDEFENFLRW
ncbi:MAG: patatin-like phospholipase family protein [Fervidobacterium sp.]|nr:patatin-like phospholipase family protein [Fervidobacterium sp.]